jgi:hypothetical protein
MSGSLGVPLIHPLQSFELFLFLFHDAYSLLHHCFPFPPLFLFCSVLCGCDREEGKTLGSYTNTTFYLKESDHGVIESSSVKAIRDCAVEAQK